MYDTLVQKPKPLIQTGMSCGVPERIVTADELKGLFGRTMDVIADCLLPQLSPKERYAIMDVCCRYEHEALQNDPCHICYPGARRRSGNYPDR